MSSLMTLAITPAKNIVQLVHLIKICGSHVCETKIKTFWAVMPHSLKSTARTTDLKPWNISDLLVEIPLLILLLARICSISVKFLNSLSLSSTTQHFSVYTVVKDMVHKTLQCTLKPSSACAQYGSSTYPTNSVTSLRDGWGRNT
jgi:hypothetical protein